MLSSVISHLVVFFVGGGIGWWIGKKGAANVAGDVKQAAEDVKSKV